MLENGLSNLKSVLIFYEYIVKERLWLHFIWGRRIYNRDLHATLSLSTMRGNRE